MQNCYHRERFFKARNALQTVWWPNFARTRWGAHSAPTDPLVELRVWDLYRRRGEMKRKGEEKRGRGEEGKDRKTKGRLMIDKGSEKKKWAEKEEEVR